MPIDLVPFAGFLPDSALDLGASIRHYPVLSYAHVGLQAHAPRCERYSELGVLDLPRAAARRRHALLMPESARC